MGLVRPIGRESCIDPGLAPARQISDILETQFLHDPGRHAGAVGRITDHEHRHGRIQALRLLEEAIDGEIQDSTNPEGHPFGWQPHIDNDRCSALLHLSVKVLRSHKGDLLLRKPALAPGIHATPEITHGPVVADPVEAVGCLGHLGVGTDQDKGLPPGGHDAGPGFKPATNSDIECGRHMTLGKGLGIPNINQPGAFLRL